jgi:hypothetical protein
MLAYHALNQNHCLNNMPQYQLAQLNIAKMKFAFESPEMSGFVDNLDSVNALADASPGFVWRLEIEDDDVASATYFGADVIPNMSVWEDVDSLREFAFRSGHAKILARRNEWFHRVEEAYAVLWWIPTGNLPTLEQAAARLEKLKACGSCSEAFTFKKLFDPG